MAKRKRPREEETDAGRREVLKLATGAAASAVVAAPLAGLHAVSAAPKASALRFFTPKEFQMVDEICELIIPADDHSPGARAAGVAAYLDRQLAEAFEAETKQEWRAGLRRLDSLSREMFARPFLQASKAERISLLTRISRNEADPKKSEEIFFKAIKARTAHAYYTSKIGIHTEMEYKGNRYLKEFVGHDGEV